MRTSLLATTICLLFVASASAHIEMAYPPPRNSRWIPSSLGITNIDYDTLTPLGPSRPYPCQGKGKGPIVATYQAGSSVHVQLYGSASHDGGHCQFSVSFDGGYTFVVLLTVVRECLRASGSEYNVALPAGAPSGDAVFSWSWINAVGNREYYQGCADITINGVSGGSITGPQLFVANVSPSSVVIPGKHPFAIPILTFL
ncbi:lytic polysaccharide monooxygenase [Gonapodya prolifera JEL478]|uniref:Lytic polysaccharide monooxygenase n=1 Tax=Gonapodya prolifera (strain JEL478) TaxID=1344416 RepID=A0A139AV70_GONPJ|nr:lytic polysaccharide monooxygenase [Gonapodya prolifera JEL478]|eukprot:KXS20385.1 lytic polysaccharide monooxygenase [Gonapodya prolifera JEL478]